jgi:uncharacterized protein (DUF1697 family)
MTAFVSLFRGINVGGNHQVKMADLKAMHEALGLRDVAPYIQSGNVVFRSDATDPTQLQGQIASAFETQFGFRSEVFVRSAAELDAVIERNPFQGQQSKEAKWLVVLFLAAHPDHAAQEALLKAYVGPEEWVISSQEMYLYYPDGQGRSKLTGSFLEKKLKTAGTARNWNTVLQVQKLLSAFA